MAKDTLPTVETWRTSLEPSEDWRQPSPRGLIIPHEPTFYTHLDDTEWLHGDAVYQAKRRIFPIKWGRVVRSSPLASLAGPGMLRWCIRPLWLAGLVQCLSISHP